MNKSILVAITILILIPFTIFGQTTQETIDSLKIELGKTNENDVRIILYNDISNYYLSISTDKSKENAYNSINIPHNEENKTEEAYSYKLIGYSFYYDYEIDSAIFYFEKSLKIYEEENYAKGMSDIYTSLGSIYANQGEFENAFDHFFQSLEIDENLGNYYDKAITQNSIGLLYYDIADYNNSLQYYQEASDYFKQNNYYEELASVYANIGNLFNEWGKFEEAIEYYNYSLIQFENLDIKYRIAGIYSNLGMVYLNLEDFTNSEEFLNKSLDINTEIQNDIGIFNSKGNLALLLTTQGKYDEALKIYLEIINIAKEINFVYELAEVYNSIGNIYQIKGNYSEAEDYILKSLKISEETENLHEKLISTEILAKTYEASKQYQKSNEAYKEYILLKDELFEEQTLEQLNEFNIKYEVEKKNQEITLLSAQNEVQFLELEKAKNQKIYLFSVLSLIVVIGFLIFFRFLSQRRNNKILQDKNHQLKILNNTKDKFFSIIAHDLKNSLSSFRTITGALSENLTKIDINELEEYLKNLHKSSNNLFDLLQNLLNWAKTQRGEMFSNPESIDLNQLISKNVQLMHNLANQKHVEIQNNINQNIQIFADKSMADTVFRNIINNAVKFTENGIISVNCKKVNNIVNVTIKDSGIGMSQNDLDKIFRIDIDTRTIGNSPNKGSGLGLILCKELIEKNNGNIEVKSELNKGSTFIITLPASNN